MMQMLANIFGLQCTTMYGNKLLGSGGPSRQNDIVDLLLGDLQVTQIESAKGIIYINCMEKVRNVLLTYSCSWETPGNKRTRVLAPWHRWDCPLAASTFVVSSEIDDPPHRSDRSAVQRAARWKVQRAADSEEPPRNWSSVFRSGTLVWHPRDPRRNRICCALQPRSWDWSAGIERETVNR